MSYFVTDDNYRLYYEEYGTEHEESIVFVHGHGGRLQYFKHQLEELQKKYHVLAYDMRGHGASEKTVKNLDMLRLGKDLHKLIEDRGLKKPAIVGWSLGSNVVLACLMQYGFENVRYVVTTFRAAGRISGYGLCHESGCNGQPEQKKCGGKGHGAIRTDRCSGKLRRLRLPGSSGRN